MLTRKQQKENGMPDSQNGAPVAQRARGEKTKDPSKPLQKSLIAQGKDAPRDMVYNTQKLNGMCDWPPDEELDVTPAMFHAARDQETLRRAL